MIDNNWVNYWNLWVNTDARSTGRKDTQEIQLPSTGISVTSLSASWLAPMFQSNLEFSMSVQETLVMLNLSRIKWIDVWRWLWKYYKYRYFSDFHQSYELTVQGKRTQFQVYSNGRESHGVRWKLFRSSHWQRNFRFSCGTYRFS